MSLRFGSVCSGIEAASVAWSPMGWSAAWFSEIDTAASALLAYRFPDVPNLGDMLHLAAKVRAREIEAPDILVGGTPCQAFSIAGLRGGLADPRGQITLAFVDLANAIDEIRRADGLPPVITVWENVPGVINHKDNPFGCFLAGLAGESDALLPAGKRWTNAGVVLGPERAIAWRVQDAQYHGLAQRRRRVFLVASAREGFDPAAILLEFDGLRRDSPPRRETGEGVTHPTSPRLTSSGRGVERTGDPRGQDPVVAVIDDGERSVCGSAGVEWPAEIACTLNAHFGSKQGLEDQHALGGGSLFVPAQRAPVPQCGRDGHTDSHANAGVMPAVVVPFDTTQITSPGNYSSPKPGDPCHPLAAGAHAPAVCVTGSVTHTLKADGFDASEDGTGRGQPIVAAISENQRAEVKLTDYARSITTSGGKPGQGYPAALINTAVRRLMPIECERLQGFPDNWTRIPVRHYDQRKISKTRPENLWEPDPRGGWWLMAADGPRYKQLGNSMATNCMRWIGRRISAHLTGLPALPGHNGGPALDPFEELLA